MHIGQIGACASDHFVLHAQGGQHLSSPMVLTGIDGGMSTVLPRSGQPVKKKKAFLPPCIPEGIQSVSK
jgi:hypothetical protein